MPGDNIKILTADWNRESDRAALKKIRRRVFIEEQQVPEELEWDEHDATARHFLVLLDNEAIACARLKNDGRIGRMAVLPEHRNNGIGTQLLHYVLQTASDQKLKQLYLHAQVSAADFYKKQGFTEQGDVFFEAGIAHKKMLKQLNGNTQTPEAASAETAQGEFHIDTVEENRQTVIALLNQAQLSVDIFTQDMAADIYNNKDVEQAIIQLAKKHSKTRVRILVQNAEKAVHNGHCLLRLAQNLSSSVFIHKPSAEYRDEKSGFLVVDRRGFLHRVSENPRNHQAIASFSAPHRAARLTDLFGEIWEHSAPDSQTRRLYV